MDFRGRFISLEVLWIIAESFTKCDLMRLRLVSRGFNRIFVTLFYNVLVREILCGQSFHLHRAVSRCNLVAIRQLLDAGAPVNQRDTNGETPLHGAARSNCVEGAQMLLRLQADVDTASIMGWTALQLAARYGRNTLISTLIDHGANPVIPGFHGWTALHYAARSGHEKAVQLLMNAGVNGDIRDNDCKTPAEHAQELGHWRVLTFLSSSEAEY